MVLQGKHYPFTLPHSSGWGAALRVQMLAWSSMAQLPRALQGLSFPFLIMVCSPCCYPVHWIAYHLPRTQLKSECGFCWVCCRGVCNVKIKLWSRTLCGIGILGDKAWLRGHGNLALRPPIRASLRGSLASSCVRTVAWSGSQGEAQVGKIYLGSWVCRRNHRADVMILAVYCLWFEFLPNPSCPSCVWT